MRLPIAGVVVAVLLSGCGGGGGAPEPEITGAWVRLPAVPGRPGAAYFDLRASGGAATLVKVTTPIAVRTELHESVRGANGVMSMKALDQVIVPAGDSVTFAPGGKHVMLFDVSPKAKAGQTVKLNLAFVGDQGAARSVDAKVVGAGDAAPKP